jgi:hypothetical protein
VCVSCGVGWVGRNRKTCEVTCKVQRFDAVDAEHVVELLDNVDV